MLFHRRDEKALNCFLIDIVNVTSLITLEHPGKSSYNNGVITILINSFIWISVLRVHHKP